MSTVTFSNVKVQHADASCVDVAVTATYTITFSPTAARLGIDYVPTVKIVLGNTSFGTTMDQVLPLVTANSEPVTGQVTAKWVRTGSAPANLKYLVAKLSMQCVPDFLSITGST